MSPYSQLLQLLSLLPDFGRLGVSVGLKYRSRRRCVFRPTERWVGAGTPFIRCRSIATQTRSIDTANLSHADAGAPKYVTGDSVELASASQPVSKSATLAAETTLQCDSGGRIGEIPHLPLTRFVDSPWGGRSAEISVKSNLIEVIFRLPDLSGTPNGILDVEHTFLGKTRSSGRTSHPIKGGSCDDLDIMIYSLVSIPRAMRTPCTQKHRNGPVEIYDSWGSSPRRVNETFW